jgi:hypothetical protein
MQILIVEADAGLSGVWARHLERLGCEVAWRRVAGGRGRHAPALFFSDGSIFNLVPNACGFFPAETPPEDLAAIIRHYAA